MCSITGCGRPDETVDPATGDKMCWDCRDEVEAVRAGMTSTMWDVATDGWKWGTLSAGLFHLFGRG